MQAALESRSSTKMTIPGSAPPLPPPLSTTASASPLSPSQPIPGGYQSILVFSRGTPFGANNLGPNYTNLQFSSFSPDGTGRNSIFYRVCPTCLAAYRLVIYKRITPLPLGSSFSIYSYMTHVWSSASNLLGVDFNLYSSWDDMAAKTNTWTYCDYDDTANRVGFPRNCAPTPSQSERYQWNSLFDTRGARDYAYYVLARPKPPLPPAPSAPPAALHLPSGFYAIMDTTTNMYWSSSDGQWCGSMSAASSTFPSTIGSYQSFYINDKGGLPASGNVSDFSYSLMAASSGQYCSTQNVYADESGVVSEMWYHGRYRNNSMMMTITCSLHGMGSWGSIGLSIWLMRMYYILLNLFRFTVCAQGTYAFMLCSRGSVSLMSKCHNFDKIDYILTDLL